MTTSLDRDAVFIGTRWRSPATNALIEVVSPHTEEVVARVPEGSVADMDAAVAAARDAFDNGGTGTYGVNTYTMDFAAPFGGFKASGIGREFGPEGLAQYTELKSVYLERS